MKILITGGHGQVGQALANHERASEFQLSLYSHAELDITQVASIKRAVDQYNPDIIINTAAYTAVDKAESEIESAASVNYQGALNLATLCRKEQIPLIHLSTDYVFDGKKTTPYTPDDTAQPLNFYGKSKLLGELAIREQHEQHVILRVSGIFSEYGNNFYKTILRLAKEKKELRIVADQITCPTYAGHIADTLFTIAKNPKHWGVYHYCDNEPASWFSFAKKIIQQAKEIMPLHVEMVNAIAAVDYPTPAKRPAYSVMDCSALEKAYGIKQQRWENGLAACFEEIRHVIST